MIATLCLPDDNGDGGSSETGDAGRVTAGAVTVEAMSTSERAWEGGEGGPEDMMVAIVVGLEQGVGIDGVRRRRRCRVCAERD